MAQPRYHLLDIVEIADIPSLRAMGISGRSAVVHQVREYPDGRHLYAVAALEATGDDEIGGVYDDGHLRATGEQVPADFFAAPGHFQVRDVVEISALYPTPGAAGQRGVIAMWGTLDGEEEPLYFVRVDGIGDEVDCVADELRAVGERIAPRCPWQMTSTTVDANGDVTGFDAYTVLEDWTDL